VSMYSFVYLWNW